MFVSRLRGVAWGLKRSMVGVDVLDLFLKNLDTVPVDPSLYPASSPCASCSYPSSSVGF
jgi:hypothetical protein